MQTRLLLFFVFILLKYTSHSQCPVGDVLIQSQTDLINFANTYPNCQFLLGDLTIRSNDSISPQISDLSILPKIKTCEKLRITNNDRLKSLAGLDSLNKVNSGIDIVNNDSLINLEGLDKLINVRGDFEISSNDRLSSLDGIASGLTVKYNLIIAFNNQLADLTSLVNIDHADGLLLDENAYSSLDFIDPLVGKFDGLRISLNPRITSLEGLEKLTYLDDIILALLDSLQDISALKNLTGLHQGLTFFGLPLLEDLESLHNLKSVGNSFNLTGLTNLVSLSGLENLTSVSRDFIIRNCDSLKNLDQLNTKLNVGDEVYLIANDQLDICANEAICRHLLQNRPAIINNNGDQCSSIQVVLDACTTTSIHEKNDYGEKFNFTVFPNPSNGIIHLTYDLPPYLPTELIIYNSTGQLIESVSPSPNIINLDPGLYFLSICTEEKILAYKKVLILE